MIMVNQHHGEPHLAHEPAQEVEAPRLHADVEPARGFVHQATIFGFVTSPRAICKALLMPPEKAVAGRRSAAAVDLHLLEPGLGSARIAPSWRAPRPMSRSPRCRRR